jgi:NAD(P)-dependent dehydrogenase (short-subunit alcohol dehydrogenase family)
LSDPGSLEGKVCVVTGASSGIGKATCKALAAKGAGIVMVCRDEGRARAAREEVILKSPSRSVLSMLADLSRMASVRELAAGIVSRYPKVDVLINDAAVYNRDRVVTPEGFEQMFATNYLGPFLLTRLMLPQLEAGKPSRVINVTAPSTTRPDFEDLQGERKFQSLRAFGASKAADLLFTYSLAARVRNMGVTANAYHPGLVRTRLMSSSPAPVKLLTGLMNAVAGASPDQAAAGLLHMSVSDEFRVTTGQLIHKGKIIDAPFSNDVEAQDRLWETSSKLVGLSGTI